MLISFMCKWVFKRRCHSDRTLNTYKARLVAKDFRQKEDVDYFDTYAPVERTATIRDRVLFALASLHSLIVCQMDVKAELLNGDLNEDNYTEQPECYCFMETTKRCLSLSYHCMN